MPKNEYFCDCTAVHADAVSEVVLHLEGDTLYRKTAHFFKILGDLTRVKIIAALNVRELCVCDIANILCMTKSAVSHQLARLRASGFVVCRRDGKTVYYSLADEHVKEILEAGIIHIQELT